MPRFSESARRHHEHLCIIFDWSEGEAERHIGTPCMIGLGLVVVEKIFRRRRRRRRRRHLGVDPKKLGFCIKNIEYRQFSSRGCFGGKKAEGLLKMLNNSIIR